MFLPFIPLVASNVAVELSQKLSPEVSKYLDWDNAMSNEDLGLGPNGSRYYDNQYQTIGGTNSAMFDRPKDVARGGLANSLIPTNGSKRYDATKYQWTLTNKNTLLAEEIPYILLTEYQITESQIKRQAEFYGKGIIPNSLNNSVGGNIGERETLFMYNEILPHDMEQKTGFTYKLPYFNKKGFELSTKWKPLGSAADTIGLIAGKDIKDFITTSLDVAGKAMNTDYEVRDRPKVFESQSERTLEIEFPLYNTVNPNDWYVHRELAYVLMSQNLFNKRDYTTGIPPVFYEVYIPSQHYSWGSYISKYDVEYLGNQRVLKKNGTEYIVPDAYNIKIHLTELVVPSKNQLEALYTGAALNYVSGRTYTYTGAGADF